MSSNSQIKKVSSQSQFDMSLSTFDCPICMEILQPPIFLCNSGHSICGSCKENLVNCPTCRDLILSMRNFQLEGIVNRSVKVDCKYCTQKFKIGEMEAHQKACNGRPIDCELTKCNENGINLKEYWKHLIQSHHFVKCSSLPKLKILSLKSVPNLGVDESFLNYVIQVEELHFIVLYTYRYGQLYFWIQCIDEFDKSKLEKFVGSISISGFKDDPAKDGVKFPCKISSIRKNFVDLKPEIFPIKLSSLYLQWGLEPESPCVLAIDIQKRIINI